MEWIGAVKDVTRLQDAMASALLNWKVMPAFEVLDSKIANGLRQVSYGNLQKASCHERKKISNTAKILDQLSDGFDDIQELQDQWRRCSHTLLRRADEG